MIHSFPTLRAAYLPHPLDRFGCDLSYSPDLPVGFRFMFVRPPRLSVGGLDASPGRRPTADHDIHAPASRRHGRHAVGVSGDSHASWSSGARNLRKADKAAYTAGGERSEEHTS